MKIVAGQVNELEFFFVRILTEFLEKFLEFLEIFLLVSP